MADDSSRGAKRGFLTGIESVRGIAALYVAFGHTLAAVLLFNYKLPIQAQPSLRDALLKLAGCVFNAQTAVVVFFVISGLVIGRALPDLLIANRPSVVIIIEAFSAFTLISLIVRYADWRHFRLLDRPFVRWNGRLSYSFYLWHLMILTVLTHELYSHAAPELMQRFELPIFGGLLLISVAIALAIAHVSYRFVEKPGIALGYRLESWWTGRAAAPAPVAAAAVEPSAP